MKFVCLSIILLNSYLFAYIDSDMDGVEDKDDQCLQTPLTDLVDFNGCSIDKITKNLYYNLILSTSYSQINYASKERADTINTSFQGNIYIDRLLFQIYSSHYTSKSTNSKKSGWDDTVINLIYTFTPTEELSLNLGGGIIIPTYISGYKNEALDYSTIINLRYSINSNLYCFGEYIYTLIKDSNINEAIYKNTYGVQIGLDASLDLNSHLSISYNNEQSLYADIQSIKSIGIIYTYLFTNNWSLGVGYTYGLSDSASNYSLSGRIGYYF